MYSCRFKNKPTTSTQLLSELEVFRHRERFSTMRMQAVGLPYSLLYRWRRAHSDSQHWRDPVSGTYRLFRSCLANNFRGQRHRGGLSERRGVEGRPFQCRLVSAWQSGFAICRRPSCKFSTRRRCPCFPVVAKSALLPCDTNRAGVVQSRVRPSS